MVGRLTFVQTRVNLGGSHEQTVGFTLASELLRRIGSGAANRGVDRDRGLAVWYGVQHHGRPFVSILAIGRISRAGLGPVKPHWSLVAFVTAIGLISLLGALARHYLGRKLIEIVDLVLLRVPLLTKFTAPSNRSTRPSPPINGPLSNRWS
jgi:hypothetical protein